MFKTVRSRVASLAVFMITGAAAVSLVPVETNSKTVAYFSSAHSDAAGVRIFKLQTSIPSEKLTPPPIQTRSAALHPFASSSPWNTAIGSNAKFESHTSTKTASFLSTNPAINRTNWSISVRQGRESDPLATLESVRSNQTFKVRIPTDTVATGGTDRHVTIIDPDGVTSSDAFKMEKISDTHWQSQLVRVVDLRSSGIGAGVRAARVPATAGLIRAHEVTDKHIPHALALAIPDSALKVGYVWPAFAQDSNAATAYFGQVPMGTLLAIPPDVDVNSLAISAEGKALGKALQDYGAYVVDRAGTAALYCELSCESGGTTRMTYDWKNLFKQMRVVSNNSSTTVGGGGTPRVPAASPF